MLVELRKACEVAMERRKLSALTEGFPVRRLVKEWALRVGQRAWLELAAIEGSERQDLVT